MKCKGELLKWASVLAMQDSDINDYMLNPSRGSSGTWEPSFRYNGEKVNTGKRKKRK